MAAGASFDLVGNHGRVRTVPMLAWAKTAIYAWTTAAGIGAGYPFRPVNRGDQVCGDRLSEIVVWQMLKACVAESPEGRRIRRPFGSAFQ
jgi:hypothetical protein